MTPNRTEVNVSWHTLSTEDSASRQGVVPAEGLSPDEASKRLTTLGPNEIVSTAGRSVQAMILAQFNDVLVWVLMAAIVMSFVVGEITDGVVILAIVVLNAILGVVQEFRAEQSLAALKGMAAPMARVRRGGTSVDIPAREVVPGDVLILEAGNIVPADARVFEAASLQADESILTGEAEPVTKSPDPVADPGAPVGDRTGMVFSSSAITYGRGAAVVVGTAGNTEVGRIASMLSDVESEQTPLQEKLEGLGKWLAVAVVLISILVFAVGVSKQQPLTEMFMMSVSLAVAAIPEGLTAVVTIVLAIGMRKMVKRNALIRRLQAVETLGATTVICTDKTGTLTQNQMTVRRWWTLSGEGSVTGAGYEPQGEIHYNDHPIDPRSRADLDLLLRAGALCNDARLHQEDDVWIVQGDPTEGALLAAAAKAGWDRAEAERDWPRVSEIPFDSDRKRMTTIHDTPDGVVALVKGAPDVVRGLCSQALVGDRVTPMTGDLNASILQANQDMANDALRVLGFAVRELRAVPPSPTPDEVETDLVFLGLVGMIDPPRPEAAEAIQRCHTAGIRPVMITGDYPATAMAIARELGMGEGKAVTGRDLAEANSASLQTIIREATVFARVSPQDKLQIVDALKDSGHVVAMTGDGVNDAPALKRADIGVAMGITGTDVAKGAADMVLTDDNFASIVAAVEEGRTVFDNIRKAVFYLLSCNISEVLTLFIAILLGWGAPLIPVQILWVNLVTDSFPALALGMEPPEPGQMKRPPRPPDEGVLNRRTIKDILFYGAFITFAVLLAFHITRDRHPGELGLRYAQTAAFLTISLAQLMHAFNSRSALRSIFSVGIFSNKRLIAGVLISASLQLCAVYLPIFHDIFNTMPLHGADVATVALLSLSPLVFGEIRKAIRNMVLASKVRT